MQEEVEHRSVTLIVNTGKFTGRVLKVAIAKYMAHQREKNRQKKTTDVIPHGKMMVSKCFERGKTTLTIQLTLPDVAERPGLTIGLRQTRQRQQERGDEAEGAGGERSEPVDVAKDDRAGADVGQGGLRKGADRADQGRVKGTKGP